MTYQKVMVEIMTVCGTTFRFTVDMKQDGDTSEIEAFYMLPSDGMIATVNAEVIE